MIKTLQICLRLSPEDEEKSRQYNISKLKLSILRNIVYVSWIIYLLFGGFIIDINNYLEKYLLSDIFNKSINFNITYMIIYISMLPLSYISTFVVEEKYGFNTSTKKLFLKDNFVSQR